MLVFGVCWLFFGCGLVVVSCGMLMFSGFVVVVGCVGNDFRYMVIVWWLVLVSNVVFLLMIGVIVLNIVLCVVWLLCRNVVMLLVD